MTFVLRFIFFIAFIVCYETPAWAIQVFQAEGAVVNPPRAVGYLVVESSLSSEPQGGSAFAMSPIFMATACHTLAGARKVTIHFGQDSYEAKLEAATLSYDFCVLRLPEEAKLTPIIMRTKPVETGEKIQIVGFKDAKTSVVTIGEVLKATTIAGAPMIVTNAPIVNGMSGGMAIDQQGEIVGIAVSRGAWPEQNFAIAWSELAYIPIQPMTTWPTETALYPPFSQVEKIWPELLALKMEQGFSRASEKTEIYGNWIFTRKPKSCEIRTNTPDSVMQLSFIFDETGVKVNADSIAVLPEQAMLKISLNLAPLGQEFFLRPMILTQSKEQYATNQWAVKWGLDDGQNMMQYLPDVAQIHFQYPGKKDTIFSVDISPNQFWEKLKSVCFSG